MSTMRQVAQKPRRKFCGQKAVKKRKAHPIQPEKGETGCVLGAGEDGNGWKQVRTDGKTRSPNQNEPHSHATHAKRKPAETQSFRRFCGRDRRTWSRLPPRVLLPSGERPAPTEAGAETGAAERHWRSLTPRHALRRAQPCLVAESLCALTKNREASVCSPLHFWQGQKDLNPRHAVLEWVWGNPPGSGGGPVLADSPGQFPKEWCWFGAERKFQKNTQNS